MKLLAGYSPIVIGAVLLVVVLAVGLIYTRRSEGFANNVRVLEGFSKEQVQAACKTIDDQINLYKAELDKPAPTDEQKKLQNDLRNGIKQMEDAKKQYGCP